MYVLCKDSLPMDVEFMLYDSLEVGLCVTRFFRPSLHSFKAVRPKLVMFKTFEEAITAVDEMFTVAFQTAGRT
jgi:regulator of nonsense transcripts 2